MRAIERASPGERSKIVDAPRVRSDEPEDHLDRRRLPGAVRAQEPENLSLPCVERYPAQDLAFRERHIAPEVLLDPVDVQNIHGKASCEKRGAVPEPGAPVTANSPPLVRIRMVLIRFHGP